MQRADQVRGRPAYCVVENFFEVEVPSPLRGDTGGRRIFHPKMSILHLVQLAPARTQSTQNSYLVRKASFSASRVQASLPYEISSSSWSGPHEGCLWSENASAGSRCFPGPAKAVAAVVRKDAPHVRSRGERVGRSHDGAVGVIGGQVERVARRSAR